MSAFPAMCFLKPFPVVPALGTCDNADDPLEFLVIDRFAACLEDTLDQQGGLLGGQVPQPLREEGGHVEVEGGGPAEGLGVAGPAQALVALGAVGGDVQEVALLPPADVVLELIDQLVRALEGTGIFKIAVKAVPDNYFADTHPLKAFADSIDKQCMCRTHTGQAIYFKPDSLTLVET